MDLNQIGFSNIRLPNDPNNYVYIYHPSINTFPEEVFLHEFLHSLERNLKEYGYDRPELHSNETYGYEEEQLNGLKYWYQDYMQCKIYDEKNSEYIGLNPIVYKLKPTAENEFKYSIETKFNDEPDNIFEEIIGMFKVLLTSFNNLKDTYELNNAENNNNINNSISEGVNNESI